MTTRRTPPIHSKFDRKKNDHYRTWDPRAVAPLLRFLKPNTRFIEPCAGDGALVDQLVAAGHECVFAADKWPSRSDIHERDALSYQLDLAAKGIVYITNPPWRLDWLHPLIEHLSDQADTWLLFHEGWVHNATTPYEVRRRLAVQLSVGRVKWFEDSDHDYTKNIAWHLFKKDWSKPYSLQFGRVTNG